MDTPTPSDGPGAAGGSNPGNAQPSGGAGSSGSGNRSRNRNRNRNRSGTKSGSGGGGTSGRSGAGRGTKAGARGAGGNSGGGNRSQGRGGSGRSSSGNRSSPQGRRPNSGGGRDRTSPPPTTPSPPVVPAIDRSTESAEEATTVRNNRRRAVRITVVPGLIIGVVVGVVLVAAGLPPYLGALGLVVAAGVSWWLWQRAPGAVLRAVGAKPSREADRPRLHNLVEGLCATMGLPQPTIAVVDSPVPNAMAVGHDPGSATLVVTSALDRYLDLVELEGVLAHELVHVKRYDTVVAGVAVVVSAPWSLIVGLPRASDRVHALIGPGREFSADQRAAAVVRYPPGVASALDAMVEGADPAHRWSSGTGRTATLTRWLWVDPMVGEEVLPSPEGNLDDTRVRAAALALR